MKQKLLLLGLFPLLGIGLAGQQATDVVAPKEIRFNKFIADIAHDNKNAYNERAMELNKLIADEGCVLLKNQDNFLPMAGTEKVSLVGKSSTSLVRGGAGSGAGSVSSGITEIKMPDSLKNVGFQVNQKLVDFYNNNSQSGSGRTNGNTGWTGISQVTIGETPMSKYSQELLGSMDEYNEAMIMVISREGSEGCDVKTCDCRDSNSDPFTTKHALELSDNEQALYDEIKKHSDNIIIIINSGNIYECDVFEKDDAVKGIIWMGTPGANGANAIGRILSGQVNPSGRTVSTWTRDFTLDPTFQNFSDNAQTHLVGEGTANAKFVPADTMLNEDGTNVRSDGTYKGDPVWDDEANKVPKYGLNGVRPAQYVSYEEGVYLDYRYYETRYEDIATNSKDDADEWYDGEEGVVYPFGYGLSYTTFDQKVVNCSVKGKSITRSDEKVNVTVKVTNTGDVAGKEVVQLYWKAPYTNGGIEKPSEQLCAFAKTGTIQPGQSEEVKLSFYIQDFANYDYTDANDNGFAGYELEGGKYQVTLNKNAHEIYEAIDCKIGKEGFQYKYDRFTGNEVVNRFSDENFYKSTPLEGGVEWTDFSRSDWDETFPKTITIEDRTVHNDRVEEFYTHRFTMADVEENDDGEYVPTTVKKTKEDIEALGWTQVPKGQTGGAPYQYSEMLDTDVDDPKWDEILNNMTYDEMEKYVTGGNDHNPAISRIGKQSTGDSDGPGKFKTMWWCGGPIVAATYNVDLARQIGDCIAIEAHNSGTYGWAGPGVNIHRSPFGGRNFEYYSADPFLTGRIAGRVISGATDGGVYCFFKHFAVNDQEKGREGVSAFVNEQALREIYLKAFQYCIQEGKSIGIMSSYNRLGMMETAASYPLLTEVLRDEWGFKGSIISDMTHRGNSAFDAGMYENINNRVLAGCNNQLDGSNYHDDVNCYWSNEKGCPVYKNDAGEEVESYSWWYAVRKCAKECMWMQARCGVYQRNFVMTAEGVTFSADGMDFNMLEARVDEEINIQVNGLDNYSGAEITIDTFTPLPEGLSFDGSAITGAATEKFNGFIHVLIKTGDTTVGATFELMISNMEVQEIAGESKKGGCGGSIVGASALVCALAACGLALLTKKRKED